MAEESAASPRPLPARERKSRRVRTGVSANQSGSGASLQSLSSTATANIAPASIRDAYSIAGRIAGMDSTSSSTTSRSERWQFLRDVMVFQLKLFLDNLRDFALVPISIVAALIDLIYKGEREGALFYKVLRWGAHSEEVINVYSAIEHHPPGDFKVNPEYTVDAVIARLEGVVMREYEKGGTAASVKAAMDRAIDQLHRETKEKGDRARDVVARAADKLRLRIDQLPPEEEDSKDQKSQI